MQFEFATATRIIFGPGALRSLGPLVAELGRHALVISGRTRDRISPLLMVIYGLTAREQGITKLVLP